MLFLSACIYGMCFFYFAAVLGVWVKLESLMWDYVVHYVLIGYILKYLCKFWINQYNIKI